MSVRPTDEKTIFLAALDKDAAPDREAFVQEACANDPELLKRVKELLSVHGQGKGPLDSPPPGVGAVPTIDQPLTERPGTLIGPYKLLQQIGEGGMGIVYMAEQTQPVRRKVANLSAAPACDVRPLRVEVAQETSTTRPPDGKEK